MIDKAIFGYSVLRSGLYFAESLPIVLLQKALKGSAQEMPEWPKERLQLIDKKVRDFLLDDASQFQAGVYPLRLLRPESPFQHLTRFGRILADSVRVGLRRKSRQNKDLPKDVGVTREVLPDYFMRNFHFQTDGYLSEQSADLYRHQVEILFKGTGAAMRRLILKGMVPLVDPKAPGTILDVACGEGASTEILAAAFPQARVTGVDISPFYVKAAAKKELSNADFLQAAGEKLPFQNQLFDRVASTYLFHELPKDVRLQVLKELHRVLKPEGSIHIADSLQLGDDPDLDWSLEQFPVDFHEPFYKNYIQSPLERTLEEAGFKILHVHKGFLTKAITATKA